MKPIVRGNNEFKMYRLFINGSLQTLTPLPAQITTSDPGCYVTTPSLDIDASFMCSVIQSTARDAKKGKAINPVPRICHFNLGDILGVGLETKTETKRKDKEWTSLVLTPFTFLAFPNQTKTPILGSKD